MERKRRQMLLLGLLAVVLAVLVYRGLGPDGLVTATRPPAPGVKGAAGPEIVPTVRLDRLEAAPPGLGGEGRNLFTMQTERDPAPAADPDATAPPPIVGMPSGTVPPPVGPLPPPPISVKFIGVVVDTGNRKMAVLKDGNAILRGHEGDIVDGRFRIVRIGDESIVMEYPDGRGRQTIRLTGGP